MSFKNLSLIAGILALVSLAGCGRPVDPYVEFGAQYWQRASVSEAAYMQGAKAQQMLNQDIADCVVGLRELERLGALREAIPTDIVGRVKDPDTIMPDWDTPTHEDYLRTEHQGYTDFEGCMLSKGWERIKYVPYDTAKQSKNSYLKSQIRTPYSRTRYPERFERR